MAHLIDTSLLVRQADPRSSARLAALEAFRRLFGKRETLYTFPQNMTEFWAVATRPQAVNGLGLTVAQTEAERVRLEALFSLLPDPPGIYDQWVQLVNQFGVSGKPTHDARIAATMLVHGITHILTFNVQDFRRFAPIGIIAVDPTTVPE